METLKVASLMAENADFVVAGIVRYLDDRLGAGAKLVADRPWQERQEMLDAGRVHAAWICGLPYVQRADQPDSRIELLAAPVMRGERYQDRPIYFSDVVVRRDSEFRSFADVRGGSWAYNEPGSHSGYNVVRYHLATMGETWDYFDRVVESGAHQTSLRMILEGEIDASAIDSTVLELELEKDPAISSKIRVVETLGPSPIPPWVILRSLPERRRETVRELLIGMDEDDEGRAILAEGPVARFAYVEDSDYDPIRRMAREAAVVSL
jgi:phosphonate transport system substrate-binding protein